MKDIINDIDSWLESGETEIYLATVVSVWGSAPRKAGSKMAFLPGGAAIAGSVSGGCVEGEVIATGDEVQASDRPKLVRFGVADETAWNVGLACGGTIEVFVERLDVDVYRVMRKWIMSGRSGVVATVIDGSTDLLGRKLVIQGGDVLEGSLGVQLDRILLSWLPELPSSASRKTPDDVELFIDVVRPAPQLFLIGGAHIAVVLAQLGKLMGYDVVVIDPRRAFGTTRRFPTADRLIHDWPDKAFAEHPPGSETAVITLSHDPKIDDPALRAALDSPAFYIGALGSRKTHAKRCDRLSKLGYTSAQLARIHAPVGLDIGADNPEEIALAVMAEIVSVYRHRECG